MRLSTGTALATGIKLARNPYTTLSALSEQADIIEVGVGPKRAYLINNPPDIKSLSIQDAKLAKSAADIRVFRKIVGNNLFTMSGGQEWRARRILEQPAFHRTMLESYMPAISGKTTALFESWEQDAANPKDFIVGDLRKNFADLSLQITADVLFGQDISIEEAGRVEKAASTLMDFFSTCVRYAGIPWHLRGLPTHHNNDYKKAKATIDRFIDEAINSTDETRGKTLLSKLKQVHKDNPTEFTRTDLADEALAFLLGSYITTSDSLTWSIYELGSQGQSFLPQLRSEADSVLSSDPTYADLRKMEFSFASFKEALRLHPPAWIISRIAQEEITLPGDINIGEGSTVIVSPYLIHRRPESWENPNHYNPNRFLDGNSLEPGSYIPFGFAPRACIGSAFAMMEAPLMLSMFTQRYNFEVQNTVTPAFMAVMRIKEELQTQLVRR